MSYLDSVQLQALGLAAFGENVRISTRASIYNPSAISLGDHVRIDDFCILSAGRGGIDIGNRIHIAAYTSLIGAGRITMADFSNLSSRVSIYSSSDDFSGSTMTNPMVPDDYKRLLIGDVFIGRHVIIGCGSVVLPGVTLGEGVAIGALSLVKGDCAPFGVYAGAPARRRNERSRALLEVEARFLADQAEDRHSPVQSRLS
jgi:galactoside O-acetyltransferase